MVKKYGQFNVCIIVYREKDDAIILSETADGLQQSLLVFKEYCNLWKLTVDTNKTKIAILSKRKYRANVFF